MCAPSPQPRPPHSGEPPLQADGEMAGEVSYYPCSPEFAPTPGSSPAFGVARLTSSGAIDTRFDYDGKLTTVFSSGGESAIHGVAITPDGKFTAAGVVKNSYYPCGSQSPDYDFSLARYNSPSGLEERRFVQQDANHNVTSIVDPMGSVVERYEYTPYGQRTVLTAAWGATTPTANTSAYAWLYGHQGGRLDPTTLNWYFRNRDLWSAGERWTQPDPLGYVDGGNVYQYVRCNPIGLTDPEGTLPRGHPGARPTPPPMPPLPPNLFRRGWGETTAPTTVKSTSGITLTISAPQRQFHLTSAGATPGSVRITWAFTMDATFPKRDACHYEYRQYVKGHGEIDRSRIKTPLTYPDEWHEDEDFSDHFRYGHRANRGADSHMDRYSNPNRVDGTIYHGADVPNITAPNVSKGDTVNIRMDADFRCFIIDTRVDKGNTTELPKHPVAEVDFSIHEEFNIYFDRITGAPTTRPSDMPTTRPSYPY